MRRAFIVAAVLVINMIFPGKDWLRGFATLRSQATSATQRSPRTTLPTGTRLVVRTIEPIDTTTHKNGARFKAALETHLQANGLLAATKLAATKLAATKKGEQLLIPSKSLLEFRLQPPASLPMPR